MSLFLLDICTKENEAWVIAESLDAIIDIFAEDETDALAGDINLIEKLQTVAPILKNKVKISDIKKRNKDDCKIACIAEIQEGLRNHVTGFC